MNGDGAKLSVDNWNPQMIADQELTRKSGLKEPILLLDDIELRLPQRKDVAAIVAYCTRNHEFHKPWEPIRPSGYYSFDFWHSQVDRIHEDFRHGRSLRMFLFDRETHDLVGYLCYNNIVRGAAQYGTIGYSLDESLQGRGCMSRAVNIANDYVFNELGLHRILANYMPRNERSGRLLKRLGFITEGFAQEFLCINGVWEDHVLTSLRRR